VHGGHNGGLFLASAGIAGELLDVLGPEIADSLAADQRDNTVPQALHRLDHRPRCHTAA
jgi:hypothetical protein